MKRIPGDLDPTLNLHIPGVAYTRLTRWGEIVQAWPKRGTRGQDPGSRAKRANFGLASIMAANPMDLDYFYAVHITRGSALMPKDFLTMCALGYGFEIREPGGKIWPVVPIDEAPPPPPPPHEVKPMWEWSLWDGAWSSVMSTTPYSTKGCWWQSRTTNVVTGLRFVWNHVLNADYRLALYEVDATATITAVVCSGDYTSDKTGIAVGEVSAVGQIESGKHYAIALSRLDAGDTHALSINFNQTQKFLFPMTYRGAALMPKAQPAIGDQFSQTTVSCVPCAMQM